jgi:hypothetical protein
MDYILMPIVVCIGVLLLGEKYSPGSLNAIGQSFAGRQHTPFVEAVKRAAAGAARFVTAACIAFLPSHYIPSYWTALPKFLVGDRPENMPAILPWIIMGPPALALLYIASGLFSLIRGWNAARGPRDIDAAVFPLFCFLAAVALLFGVATGMDWALLHLDFWGRTRDTLNYLLPWCYAWFLVNSGVKLFLLLRGEPTMRVPNFVREQKVHGDTGFVSDDDLEDKKRKSASFLKRMWSKLRGHFRS